MVLGAAEADQRASADRFAGDERRTGYQVDRRGRQREGEACAGRARADRSWCVGATRASAGGATELATATAGWRGRDRAAGAGLPHVLGGGWGGGPGAPRWEGSGRA